MIADPYATHDLPRRLSQLARALDLAEGRLAPEVVQPGRELLQQRGVRGSSSLALTTACLIGRATDGKWELLESLAQMPQDFPVEIVDPDAPVACLWRPVAASGLLDAFRVPEGNVLRLPSGGRSAKSPAEYCGDLMLVDVPPGFDPPPPPTEIDPLARVIDLLVWVVQHERMSAAERTRSLDSVASHAEVAVVVVNEAHRFRPDTLRARLGALRAALVGVGAREVPVLAVSAQTGQGIDVLAGMLERAVRTRRDRAERLAGDVTRVAAKIHIACGGHDRAVLKPSVGRAFLADVVKAADVDLVVRALGRAYRRRGHRATGWFPRAQPASPQLSPRTPERISVGRSRVDLAVRHLIEEVAGDGPLARRARLRDVASRAAEGLFDALEPAMARIGLALPADQAWWAAVPYLRWASLVSATAGFALLAGSGSGWNDLSQILIGVGVIGWMSAATASTWATARTSTRAQQSAKLWLTAVVEDEARSRVLVPLTAEIEAWRECQNTAREARGVSP